jgi:CheY-like chemotaxis protein
MQSRVLDLNSVVGNLAKMLKRVLGEDVILHVHQGPGLSAIKADIGMMEQVLMNLTVNARDAMPHGGALTISTSNETIEPDYVKMNPQARPGNYVCLAVTDTGIGIPPEVLSRIFEPFFTTKEIGKGTGLGLSTVYGVVQQHQGWISVYSEIGHGTVFRIFFPAVKTGWQIMEPTAESEVRGGKETILLVEDALSVRVLARSVLERYGYKVIEADSGINALEIWHQHHDRIDLVLTDMVMPGGINGLELVKRLRKQKPALRAIYASGYSADVVGKESELQEGVNFLQKPYPPAKLARTVRHALDQ